ncbi:DUF1349 domain-containing protein [Streptomyces yokosukanensis]|uniref:DUF1349 domain-containing protein n=1 Tax=Streptomyces yokosukanensis TaxID=67386 RepID=UPI003133AD47
MGAVVTHGVSDWSLAPVPDWHGRTVTVRASRSGDAVTVRARCGDGPWRMVRLAPLPPEAPTAAGPFCCSPEWEGCRSASPASPETPPTQPCTNRQSPPKRESTRPTALCA